MGVLIPADGIVFIIIINLQTRCGRSKLLALLLSGAMLTDTHMHAVHKLLKKQFPGVQGCQSTLLQQNKGFTAVSGEGMYIYLVLHVRVFTVPRDATYYIFLTLISAVQIHYNGAVHWVASSNVGGELKLYDSKAADVLPSSIDEQLAAIYQGHRGSTDALMVTRVPVQQQEGGVDCGLFAVAFAFHLLHGDNIRRLTFDQGKMRRHLVECFERQELKPFPAGRRNLPRCTTKHFFIPLYCTCGMPESFDRNMVECEECEEWFHYKCVGLTSDPDIWTCVSCTK